MVDTFQYDGEHVVLVEGKNDGHLISALCKYFDMPRDVFGVYECGSDRKALQRLNALINGSVPKQTIGLVIDADAPSLQGKWQAISDRLRANGYLVPERPESRGTIIHQAGMPTIGVWLMPDNDTDGMLEDFCMRLAPQAAIDHAIACVASAQAGGHSTFTPTHMSKAAIHTYLAWQDEPGMPMGQAISKRALDPTQSIAQIFHEFLLQLFFQKPAPTLA